MAGAQRLANRSGTPVVAVLVLTSVVVLVLAGSDVPIPEPAVVVGTGLLSLVVIAVATAFEFRDQHPFPVAILIRRLGLLLVAFGLMGLLWAVRDPDPPGRIGDRSESGQSPAAPTATPTGGAERPGSSDAASTEVELVVVLIGLAVLGLLVWLVWDRLQRGRRVPAARSAAGLVADAGEVADHQQRERQRQAVREGLRRGRGALLAEDDPRRAVIQAYLVFERHIRGYGLVRRPAETQREFAIRVLADGGLDAGDRVRPLVELFNVARFSDLTVTTADARRARDHIDAMVGA